MVEPTDFVPGQPIMITGDFSDNLSGVNHSEIYVHSPVLGNNPNSWFNIGEINGSSGSVIWENTEGFFAPLKFLVLVEDYARNQTTYSHIIPGKVFLPLVKR